MKNSPRAKSDPRPDLLLQGRLHDPFAFLGLHQEKEHFVLRVFNPYAAEISLIGARGNEKLQRVHPDGLFEWQGTDAPAKPYQLNILVDGKESMVHDPYAFPPQISNFDLQDNARFRRR